MGVGAHRTRAGDIGPIRREIVFEPLTEPTRPAELPGSRPPEEPVPVRTPAEPAGAPGPEEPVPVRIPAEPAGAPAPGS